MDNTITEKDLHALEGLLEPHKKMDCVGDCMQSQALVKVIKLAKAYQSASLELPERQKHMVFLANEIDPETMNLKEGRTVKDWVKYGSNQMRDIALPIVTKLKERIDELEDAIETTADCLESKHEEVTKLQARITLIKGANRTANKLIEEEINLKTKHIEENQALNNKLHKQRIINIIEKHMHHYLVTDRVLDIVAEEIIGDSE